MDQVTQANASNAEESASAAEELSSQSQQLKEMISFFKYDKGEKSAAGIPGSLDEQTIQQLLSMAKTQGAEHILNSGAAGGNGNKKESQKHMQCIKLIREDAEKIWQDYKDTKIDKCSQAQLTTIGCNNVRVAFQLYRARSQNECWLLASLNCRSRCSRLR